jgi:hypothetical protein
MKSVDEARLREIIRIAKFLGWTKEVVGFEYPIMQLSEVEKCMCALVDDFDFFMLKKWEIQKKEAVKE